MKVLSITPAFHPYVGGLGQVVLELALQARAHGVQMDVAHVAPQYRALREDALDSLRVFRVPLPGGRLIGYAPQLGRLTRSYDLLHVHDPQLLALTGNVRLQCGKLPAVLSTHGGFWHTRRFGWAKRLYERTLLPASVSHYRRVLASSTGDAEYFKAHSTRVHLCSNGVHVQRFNRVEHRPARGLLRWIYWGRLARNKRIDRVIDCVAAARALGHAVELLVCGRDFDGLRPELNAQVERLGLAAAVRFEAHLDDDALLAELALRDLYITATEHEGFGLAIVEAMAAGLAVACRDMSPLNGFVRHGHSGWFLRFDGGEDDRRVLGQMLSLSGERAQALSAAARESAARHDWSIAAARFVGHYREVLNA